MFETPQAAPTVPPPAECTQADFGDHAALGGWKGKWRCPTLQSCSHPSGSSGGHRSVRGGRGCWGLQLWGSCQLLPGLELLEPLESPAAPRSPRTPRSLAPRQPGKGFVSFQAGRGEFQWSPHKNSLWGEPAPGRGGGMRRDDLSDDFIPLSAPKIHGNLIRKGLKIQREGRGQHPLPLPKMSPWGRCMQASRSHAGATRAPGLFPRGVHGGDNR